MVVRGSTSALPGFAHGTRRGEPRVHLSLSLFLCFFATNSVTPPSAEVSLGNARERARADFGKADSPE